jgi:predicted negative regulator of RcsB-dependent stress response
LGSHAWKAYQQSQGEAAADAYGTVEKAFLAKDATKTREAAELMAKNESGHALTARAMLLAAKAAFEANDLDHTKVALQWVADHAKEDALVDIAHLRLAAVLMDQKQFDAALKVVDMPKTDAYSGLFADARGDALALKGDKAAAKKAYQDAINKLEKGSPMRQLIETKQSALGV